MERICSINNIASHYRSAIFRLLDTNLNIDFYFGDKAEDIVKMDYFLLLNFKGELQNRIIYSPFYWQKGAVLLFFRNYDAYLITGEYFCLSTWMILLLSKFSKKKIYFWTHGWYGNENRIKQIVKKTFFSLSDGLFLYGNYAKELMMKQGFPGEKLSVIYNSLDYGKQLQVRAGLKDSRIFKDYFKNEYSVLIYIGRLSKVKKLDQFVVAINHLQKKQINVNVVFVGSGSEEIAIKEKIRNYSLENVWFFGSCYDEVKIGELIYNSTICISPGNVGLTAMHSLVYGTPVISHSDFSNQMPEFEAIIPRITGDFFLKDNELDLANKIESWLLNNTNRDAIRTQCYKMIDEKYNPNFQLDVFKSVLLK